MAKAEPHSRWCFSGSQSRAVAITAAAGRARRAQPRADRPAARPGRAAAGHRRPRGQRRGVLTDGLSDRPPVLRGVPCRRRPGLAEHRAPEPRHRVQRGREQPEGEPHHAESLAAGAAPGRRLPPLLERLHDGRHADGGRDRDLGRGGRAGRAAAGKRGQSGRRRAGRPDLEQRAPARRRTGGPRGGALPRARDRVLRLQGRDRHHRARHQRRRAGDGSHADGRELDVELRDRDRDRQGERAAPAEPQALRPHRGRPDRLAAVLGRGLGDPGQRHPGRPGAHHRLLGEQRGAQLPPRAGALQLRLPQPQRAPGDQRQRHALAAHLPRRPGPAGDASARGDDLRPVPRPAHLRERPLHRRPRRAGPRPSLELESELHASCWATIPATTASGSARSSWSRSTISRSRRRRSTRTSTPASASA